MPVHRVYNIEIYCDESTEITINSHPLLKENTQFDKKTNALKFTVSME